MNQSPEPADRFRQQPRRRACDNAVPTRSNSSGRRGDPSAVSASRDLPGRAPDLTAVVSDRDPLGRSPSDQRITAARSIPAGNGVDPELAHLWADFTRTAAHRLIGAADEPALRIGQLYRHALSSNGLTREAVTVCRQLEDGYRQLGREGERLAAQIALANALNDDGQCKEALETITAARCRWQQQPGNQRHGEQIVLSHAVFLAACGHPHDAVRQLDSDGRLLAGLAAAYFDEAGTWFAAAERRHIEVCERTGRQIPDGDRHKHWVALLTHFVGAGRA